MHSILWCNLLKLTAFPKTPSPFNFRLRHEKLKIIPKDTGGPNAYKSLKYFDLEETPPMPAAPSTADIDDPFDIKI